MSNKKFLVPILALAAFGLPVRADIVEYCSGLGCGTNTQSAFNNDVSVGGYTLGALTTFSAATGILSGTDYTDTLTQIMFDSFQAGPGSPLSDTGGILATATGDNSIVITLPASILVLSMTINVGAGLCSNDCEEFETSGFLAIINNGSPTQPWTFTISPLGGLDNVQISGFQAGGLGQEQTSDTPEVGTLILIGAGLISMRWMRRLPAKFFRTPQTA
jgi:hypothetical protein